MCGIIGYCGREARELSERVRSARELMIDRGPDDAGMWTDDRVALGRPTIANRGRSTEDVWAEQRAVHLTDSPAPHALAGAVTKLLADTALRDRLSESARRLHAERFAMIHGVAALRGDAASVEAPT